jgi:catechol 2,3-dioxygenase-like lactoylglutathione lyase family enzyme
MVTAGPVDALSTDLAAEHPNSVVVETGSDQILDGCCYIVRVVHETGDLIRRILQKPINRLIRCRRHSPQRPFPSAARPVATVDVQNLPGDERSSVSVPSCVTVAKDGPGDARQTPWSSPTRGPDGCAGRSDAPNSPEMTDPKIDVAALPAPTEGFVMTMFITVRNVARSRAFYSEVLGGTVVLDENPCIVKLANSWIIMNPGGPPTPDKPDITVVDYEPGDTTSIFLNLRVADIGACHREWSERGATFLTPPIDRGAELRCYMRDPDGYLIEVGQATGILSGHLAAKRPEDLPGY